ncbi:MAG: ATP-binding protein [Planctomycetota bacterium]
MVPQPPEPPVLGSGSLRTRIAGLVALLVLLVTVVQTGGGYLLLRQHLEGEARQRLTATAQVAREVLRSFIEEMELQAVQVASRTRLRELVGEHLDGELDADALRRAARPILRDARAAALGLDAVWVVDPRGRVLVSTDPSKHGRAHAGDVAFREGLSAAYVGPPSHPDSRAVAIVAAPLARGARLLGVVMAEVDLSSLEARLTTVTGADPPRREVLVARPVADQACFLFPRPGRPARAPLEEHPAMREACAGAEGFLETRDHRGAEVLAVHLPVGRGDWGLVAKVDSELAYAPVTSLTAGALAVAAGLVLLGAAGAWLLAGRLVRPLRDLARAAASLGRGDLSARAEVPASGEVAVLGTTFNAMAAALAEQTRTLEERVAARTAELTASERALGLARDEAEAASRAKSEFLANMSHEIRTPLNGVLGMAEVLARSELTPDQRRSLAVIRESGQALLELLSDILDLSRIEAGRLEVVSEPLSLREVIEGAVQGLEVDAARKGLALEQRVSPDVPEHLAGDAGRLRQVLVNLLSNAIKFTEQGRVGLAVAVEERGADHVVLHARVDDTGIGIPPDELEGVFESFRQVEGTLSRRQGGSGLGLAIARRIVELLGGRIWLESEPGRGTSAHFTARLALAPPPEPPAQEEAAGPVAPRRVLVAEDSAVNREVVRRLLELRGHRVEVAHDGREAIARAARERFDVILMDLQMPEVDGFEATARIRAREAESGARTPIVALTGHALAGDRERCLAAGMDDHLPKPIRPDELYRAVEAHPAGRGAAAEGAAAEGAATEGAAAEGAAAEGAAAEGAAAEGAAAEGAAAEGAAAEGAAAEGAAAEGAGPRADDEGDALDLRSLAARHALDPGRLRDLVEGFRAEWRELLSEAEAARSAGDLAALQGVGGSLQLSLEMLGCPRAARAAGDLETAPDLPAAEAALRGLLARLGRLERSLSDALVALEAAPARRP